MVSIDDYIIDHRNFDWSKLLDNWSWLLPERLTPWIMNRISDLFIVLDDGTVHMLDVGGGSLKAVAKSRDDFAIRIDEDDNANDWLAIPLVDRLVASGITLQPGQCYGFRKPPILGGGYSVDNIAVLRVEEYYGAYGSIHQQINGLPDGSRVVIRAKFQ